MTLRTVVPQAPLSMEFFRQEYWSGLPFPPPGDLPDPGIKPMSLRSVELAGGFFTTNATWEARQAPLSMGFSRQEHWSGLACPLPGDLPNPGIKPRSPTLQADSLPSEPLGKPKNTGVGSLSLLQGNFPTQVSNRGVLNCRQVLYQLSY